MTSQIIKYTDRLKHADWLIRQKATGSPKFFARQLHVSESHLYNILDELRLLGMPLAYSKTTQSYYYTQPVKLHIDFSVVPLSETEAEKIEGGKNLMLNLCYYNFIRVWGSIFAVQ